VSLIGIVESLEHVVRTERSVSQSDKAALTAQRLQQLRGGLLAEGLRHGKAVGAARDSILATLKELRHRCVGQRALEWVLAGLEYQVQDVQPPPPPPPSSYGPQEVEGTSARQKGQITVPLGGERTGNGKSKAARIVAGVAESRRKTVGSGTR
jgi:hypothetical protein